MKKFFLLPPFDENCKIKLVPFYLQKNNTDFFIVKRDDITVLKTSEAGIKTLKFLKKGYTIDKIKNIFSQKYNIEKSEINLNPILETLIENQFVAIWGDNVLIPLKKTNWIYKIKFFLLFTFPIQLFNLLFKYLAVRFSYPLINNFFSKNLKSPVSKKNITKEILDIISLDESVNWDIPNTVEANIKLLKQLNSEQYFCFMLSNKKISAWFDKFFIVENLEILINNIKRNKGLILCGFHTGSYIFLPCILAKNNVEVHTPIVFEEVGFEKVVDRLHQANDDIFPVRVHIYKRDKHDGLRFFNILRNNGVILLFCDTHIHQTEDLEEVDFFAQKIKVNRGIAFLHKKTNKPIIPVLTYNQGNYHYIKFLEKVENMQHCTEQEILQKIFSILQNFLINDPKQWTKWDDLNKMKISQTIT